MAQIDFDEKDLPDGYEITEKDGQKFLRRKQQTAPPQPPKTSDIVNDTNSKRIRELETKIAASEDSNSKLKTELDSLRELVKKAGETTLPQNPPKQQTVLGYLNDLVFGPSTTK